jgi:hypothetical protein
VLQVFLEADGGGAAAETDLLLEDLLRCGLGTDGGVNFVSGEDGGVGEGGRE